MRTSSAQFQLLVEYMETNGDLSKPSVGPQGKVLNTKRWMELTEMLNSDATGDSKTVDKWRKVWSDYKNNTKRKASRIYKSAQRTGGGPASNLNLSDLEERVLRILGTQAATGITTIPEIGLEEETSIRLPPDYPSQANQSQQEIDLSHEDWSQPGSSTEPPVFPPVHSATSQEPRLLGSVAPQDTDIDTDPHSNRSERRPTSIGLLPTGTPSVLHHTTANRSPPQSPTTPLPHTPRRRRRGRLQNLTSPLRRTRTQTQSDLARQAFVRSDCEWKAFQQETQRERNRLRELELRMQEKWMELFGEFLIVFRQISSNLENR